MEIAASRLGAAGCWRWLALPPAVTARVAGQRKGNAASRAGSECLLDSGAVVSATKAYHLIEPFESPVADLFAEGSGPDWRGCSAFEGDVVGAFDCVFRVQEAIFGAEDDPAIAEVLGVLAVHFEGRPGICRPGWHRSGLRGLVPDLGPAVSRRFDESRLHIRQLARSNPAAVAPSKGLCRALASGTTIPLRAGP